MIVSSSYLKSANCMYEVMELLKDSHYTDKVLSIVTPDADVYSPISRARYIQYWEHETQKLEMAIKPLKLENTAELTMELRKYKSIESSIASFLDLISDKNNPRIMDAVCKIKELVDRTYGALPVKMINSADKHEDMVAIHIEAGHYAFLKFAALTDISGTSLEKMVGTKKLDAKSEQDPYDLPMLSCKVINNSDQEIQIHEPIIEGSIQINDTDIQAIGFMLVSETKKRLKPNASAEFFMHGPVIISIIKALFENKITAVYAEDNFGFRHSVDTKEIDAVTAYFREYCSDLPELQAKHDKYCL